MKKFNHFLVSCATILGLFNITSCGDKNKKGEDVIDPNAGTAVQLNFSTQFSMTTNDDGPRLPKDRLNLLNNGATFRMKYNIYNDKNTLICSEMGSDSVVNLQLKPGNYKVVAFAEWCPKYLNGQFRTAHSGESGVKQIYPNVELFNADEDMNSSKNKFNYYRDRAGCRVEYDLVVNSKTSDIKQIENIKMKSCMARIDIGTFDGVPLFKCKEVRVKFDRYPMEYDWVTNKVTKWEKNKVVVLKNNDNLYRVGGQIFTDCVFLDEDISIIKMDIDVYDTAGVRASGWKDVPVYLRRDKYSFMEARIYTVYSEGYKLPAGMYIDDNSTGTNYWDQETEQNVRWDAYTWRRSYAPYSR